MFNTVHLQTLQVVLRTGSFSGAAKELGYTTSAVSQQVAALERAAGVQLFERSPRSLLPTAAALHLERRAAVILSGLAEAAEAMRGLSDGHQGRLRVAGFATANAQLLPKALARLNTLFHQAQLSLQAEEGTTDVAEAVCDGRIDLGLVSEYDLVPQRWSDELRMFPLLDEELVVISGPGSRSRGTEAVARTSISRLSKETWVTGKEGSVEYENLVRLCAQCGFEPRISFTNEDFDVIRGIVREDLGIALVPALALGIDRAITMQRLKVQAPRRRVFAICRATDANPLVFAAVDAMKLAAADFVRWTTEAFGARIESPLAAASESDEPAR